MANGISKNLLGSTLVFFSSEIQNNKPENIAFFFLAREGYWLEQAFKRFCKGRSIKAQSEYLLASRAFLFKLLLDDERSFAYSLKSGFKGTFSELLQSRFILNHDEITRTFSPALLAKIIDLETDKQSVIDIFNAHKAELKTLLAPTKKAYLAYLEQLGVTKQQTLHIVDLGYSGTIQSLLGILLNKNTYGHYLIASNPGVHFIEGCTATMKGYLKEGVKIGEGYLPLDRSMFLESLLTAPNGQFRDIRFNTFNKSSNNLKQFDFYYGRKVASQKYFYILEQVMAGALDYVEHAAKHNITFTKSELEMLLNSYLSKPHMIPHSLAHIFDIDDDVTGNGTVNALQFFGLNK
ncbi:HAD family hydrolase [Pseudoalteromonas agarivorans]|uniref:HAD family hydrolase n=1 Tax=Pseudoalteromonas agarivorans TaxID=176102 RepID=UPI002118A4BB|nr:HAD family hydrolase [Pseudoalteromonas agarivorans]MCQ8822188.1 HAD family hydrolase [Pseudoalteromonas agarivorans]